MCVPNVKRYELSSSTLICQYPALASNFEKYFAPDICEKISSAVGSGWCSRFIALFKGRGSIQTLNFPFGFSVTTRACTHSVGLSTGSITSSVIILSNSFSNSGFNAKGTRRMGVITGVTFSSISIW